MTRHWKCHWAEPSKPAHQHDSNDRALQSGLWSGLGHRLMLMTSR